MATKHKTVKKTATPRRTRPTVVEPEEEPTQEVAQTDDAPQLSAEQQAAVDMENAKLQGFTNQVQMQYLQGRVADMAIENAQLRETIAVLQRRLQALEEVNKQPGK